MSRHLAPTFHDADLAAKAAGQLRDAQDTVAELTRRSRRAHHRCQQACKENETLRGENAALRNQLDALRQRPTGPMPLESLSPWTPGMATGVTPA